ELNDRVQSAIPKADRLLAACGARAGSGRETTLLLEDDPVDVFVEASTAITAATETARVAVRTGAHVVWMNAEADLAFGQLVAREAAEAGLVATSDAGDQHGVLARLLDETELWGWETVQAGNIKGFLDRAATPAGLAAEAAKRRLDPRACCAYTDGTKLAIEMALIGNARDLRTPSDGMRGPRAKTVEEALDLFDLEAARGRPEVDYLLGARPGGGVYVIGYQEDPGERFLLDYYKLGPGPFYLHYRPCHLCHVETPYAIALAALDGRAVLSPGAEKARANDVFAVAKVDLQSGEALVHGIGSPLVRGELRQIEPGDTRLPVWMFHDAPGAVVRKKVPAGAFLTHDDVDILHPALTTLLAAQEVSSPRE
ncbi:MAG: hypothetical protein JJT96_20665, partial [Opitutales bacterium]|nr:hypothetical protein [Opitutales bacterium]